MAKRYGRPSAQYGCEPRPPDVAVMVALPSTTPSTERAAI